MSYLVLARKYRPQTFDDIVGQQHVTRTLANAFSQDRVHHAFLFCGPRGVGKTTAARVLGKALNCESGASANPCGECRSCRSIADGSAVDYHEMDGASNRGIDAIRELKEAVRYQPAVLRKKVYVIDEVHMLTTEAFNALLKTLEEPPPHVCFVLATTEPHKLPNTILSRCQRYDFKLVPAMRLGDYVSSVLEREKIEADTGAISLIVRESGGSVRDAMSICDQVISFAGDRALEESLVAEVLGLADRSLTLSIFDALVGARGGDALAAVDGAVARGIAEVQIARALVRVLRDLAAVGLPNGSAVVDATEDELAELRDRAERIASHRVRVMFERMLHACDELARSQQPRLVLDLALIDLAVCDTLEPIGGLIDRLRDLEDRLGAGDGPMASQALARSSHSARRPEPSPSASRPEPSPSASRPEPSPPPARPESAAPATRPEPSPPPARPEPSPPPARPEPSPPAGGRVLAPAQWEQFIITLEEQRKLALVRLFQEAKLLRCEESTLVVGFPAGSIDAELASEPQKQAEMAALLDTYFGRPIDFAVVQLTEAALAGAGDTAQSLAERSAERLEIEREARQREAREHPMTRLVLTTFGAEIKEIKTDV